MYRVIYQFHQIFPSTNIINSTNHMRINKSNGLKNNKIQIKGLIIIMYLSSVRLRSMSINNFNRAQTFSSCWRKYNPINNYFFLNTQHRIPIIDTDRFVDVNTLTFTLNSLYQRTIFDFTENYYDKFSNIRLQTWDWQQLNSNRKHTLATTEWKNGLQFRFICGNSECLRSSRYTNICDEIRRCLHCFCSIFRHG